MNGCGTGYLVEFDGSVAPAVSLVAVGLRLGDDAGRRGIHVVLIARHRQPAEAREPLRLTHPAGWTGHCPGIRQVLVLELRLEVVDLVTLCDFLEVGVDGFEVLVLFEVVVLEVVIFIVVFEVIVVIAVEAPVLADQLSRVLGRFILLARSPVTGGRSVRGGPLTDRHRDVGRTVVGEAAAAGSSPCPANRAVAASPP